MGPETFRLSIKERKTLGGTGIFVKNRGQSKGKVVPEETPAKLVHVFAKKLYQIQSKFNNSVWKKLKDALEADTSEDHSTFLEEGIDLIKQRINYW